MKCLALFLLPLLLAGAQAPPADRTSWRVVATGDGVVIGTIAETRSADGRETSVEQRFTVQERGDSATTIVERTVTRRDPDGRVATIAKEQQAGRSTATTEAQILADRAVIVQRSPSAPPRTTIVPLPPASASTAAWACLPGGIGRQCRSSNSPASMSRPWQWSA
jgi:hypothetical protein